MYGHRNIKTNKCTQWYRRNSNIIVGVCWLNYSNFIFKFQIFSHGCNSKDWGNLSYVWMTKSAQNNNKSDTKHTSVKSETKWYTYIYERAQSDKGLFAVMCTNYDVCRQFNPQNTINNVTTVKLQLTESITLTLIRNLTGNYLTGNLTHTKLSLRKAQPTFHWVSLVYGG